MNMERREVLAGLLCSGLVAAWGPSEAYAQVSFEEFMAEKRRKEKQKELRRMQAEGLVPDADSSSAVDGDISTDTPSQPSQSVLDQYKNVKPEVDADPLKTAIVAILRIQEATLQEARLINTGNFRDLQRNNIKMATKMMIENYKMNDIITKASAFAKPNQINDCSQIGREAVQDLQTILDYFDEQPRELKVSELSADKKEFVIKALTSCRQKLDQFLSYFPTEKIAEGRKQVMEENEMNRKELPADIQILNPVFMN
ncbi:hypothetical protein GUITHDRAFT_108628 [Guillardia theta CCMP2712]|uniref:Uncharacterized protein n=1 Tax=Guillardia theta (strain CCMP2712) TaxID=905079 RepID=L1JB93_GUITC|nr:hypothetical protein GUITHDRAFT_108628 [Guillardia theta CCMP2712]EKX45360.1 hypothetical protein GUITHDRAFT_108628 [Guillardia theta CCMP2712]|eukprot:XP_005832340.1 hypothetical protein GUITHDRAFT_108628 [Guillardia theta CCMP2712]